MKYPLIYTFTYNIIMEISKYSKCPKISNILFHIISA